jgi:hypothetical protein
LPDNISPSVCELKKIEGLIYSPQQVSNFGFIFGVMNFAVQTT